MRLHSNILTANDIRGAAWSAGTTVEITEEGGSRLRKRGFTVKFPRRTWDSSGKAMALLYSKDPHAVWGTSLKDPRGYRNVLDFNYRTMERYMDRIEDFHEHHNWEVSPDDLERLDCKKCSASLRRGHVGWE